MNNCIECERIGKGFGPSHDGSTRCEGWRSTGTPAQRDARPLFDQDEEEAL